MYRVIFGQGSLSFELPDAMKGILVKTKPLPPIENLDQAIQEALGHPINSSPLRELARPHSRVCLVVTDNTRPCPNARLLPGLIAELEKAGVEDGNITVIIGLGMHRPYHL